MLFEEFSYQSGIDATAPLFALCAFEKGSGKKPLMVCMHSYGGDRRNMGPCLEGRAAKGFFALAPDLRGRADSAGRRDDGGLEIADIYDAVMAALKRYPDEIDPDNLNLSGWSGGGGNAFQALSRIVGVFRSVQIFYGICDYGFLAASTPDWHRQITANVGAPETERLKYFLRNAANFVTNHRFSTVHLFWDESETICPREMNYCYLRAAAAAGLDRVRSFESREGDEGRWFHGNERRGDLAEAIYEPAILRGEFPAAGIPETGTLWVPGFLITPYFTLIGNGGDNVLLRVDYRHENGDLKLTVTRVEGTLEVLTVQLPGGRVRPVTCQVDGIVCDRLICRRAGMEPVFRLYVPGGETTEIEVSWP